MRIDRKSKGSVSAVALLIMMTLLMVALSLGALSIGTMRRTSRNTYSNLALLAAQGALELEATQGLAALRENNGRFIKTNSDFSVTLASIAPGSTITATIDPMSDPKQGWVTATATVKGFTRSVRSRLRGRNVGIWNNAIFAGSGASGQSINGNVDIRGSMHLLGEGESYSDLNGNGQRDPAELFTDSNRNGVWDPGEAFSDANNDGVWSAAEPYNDTNRNGYYDPPITTTDMNSSFSGTAYVGNNYSGMPIGLEGLVPSLMGPGITLETLNAEVRCKHGKIAISGNASIGTSAVIDGGTSKGTLDGVYVNDGFGGNQGSSSVFSDNGTGEAYDLDGFDIHFPLITGIGAEPYETGGNSYATYKTFYDSRALTVNVSTIKSTTTAFSYGPDAYGNRISFTPQTSSAPATLNIQGVVKIAGDLQIGAKDSVRYTGNGTIYSAGTIRVDGDFLPLPGTKFPTTARVGLVAQHDLMLATGSGSSQLSMAGAFYAQGTIVSRKQNQIAGTFVANYYDMGTNVPNIYQVPELVHNMPPAMPGDKMIYTIQQRTWRER